MRRERIRAPGYVPPLGDDEDAPLQRVAASLDGGDPVRVLSVRQPWASLLVAGVKKYETRHWNTDYRGWVALHAARTTVPLWDGIADAAREVCAAKLGAGPLPLGAILGLYWLQECTPTSSARWDQKYQRFVSSLALWVRCQSEIEQALTDFSKGRHVWHLRPIAAVSAPVPFRATSAFGIAPRALRRELAKALHPRHPRQVDT